MSRVWIYQTLQAHEGLANLVGDRIFSTSSLNRVPDTKPFLMVRMVADTPRLRGDDHTQATSETYLVFAHDNPGDYMRIDSLLAMVRDCLENLIGSQIIRAEWIENSEDFRDEDMGTIMRYSRIRITRRA